METFPVGIFDKTTTYKSGSDTCKNGSLQQTCVCFYMHWRWTCCYTCHNMSQTSFINAAFFEICTESTTRSTHARMYSTCMSVYIYKGLYRLVGRSILYGLLMLFYLARIWWIRAATKIEEPTESKKVHKFRGRGCSMLYTKAVANKITNPFTVLRYLGGTWMAKISTLNSGFKGYFFSS